MTGPPTVGLSIYRQDKHEEMVPRDVGRLDEMFELEPHCRLDCSSDEL